MPSQRRPSASFSRPFTFGGRLPVPVGVLLVLVVGLSIADALSGHAFTALLALVAPLVLAGQLWRLATYTLLELNPIGLLFAGLMLWQWGPMMVWRWGERRFLARYFGITVGAGVATVLVSLAWPAAGAFHASAWTALAALVVVWSLENADQQFTWFGAFAMSGRGMAWTMVAITGLFGLLPQPHPPLLVAGFSAIAIGWSIAGGRVPVLHGLRRRWYQLRAEMHVRAQRRRARHLKVVKKDGHDGPPRWMN